MKGFYLTVRRSSARVGFCMEGLNHLTLRLLFVPVGVLRFDAISLSNRFESLRFDIACSGLSLVFTLDQTSPCPSGTGPCPMRKSFQEHEL